MDGMSIIAIIGSCFALMSILVTMFIFLAAKIDSLKVEIHQEMKDFHGRLCAIEERNQHEGR